MSTTEGELSSWVNQRLPGEAIVEIEETAGTLGHYTGLVVSDLFYGLDDLHRRRIVAIALGDTLGQTIKALALVTLTYDEWKPRKPERPAIEVVPKVVALLPPCGVRGSVLWGIRESSEDLPPPASRYDTLPMTYPLPV